MTDPGLIITETYRLTPATYFKTTAGVMLPGVLAACALLVTGAAIAAILFDLRIILVALIILFLIVPFVISHIYFSKLLTAEAQQALTPKHVEISPGESVKEFFESSDKENIPLQPICHDWKDISEAKINNKNIILTFSNKNSTTLIIPISAIPYPTAKLISIFDSIPASDSYIEEK